MNDEEQRERLQKAGSQVEDKHLTWGSSGNISCRVSSTDFLISPSGLALGELAASDFVRCRVGDAPAAVESSIGTPRPSVEVTTHAALYRIRPDVGAVLHASPFFATLISATSLELDVNLTTDSAYYLERVSRAAFRAPGSRELANEAAAAAHDSETVILDNHGALTLGSNPEEAVRRMEILEILCRMTVYGALGLPLQALTNEQVGDMMRSLESQSGI